MENGKVNTCKLIQKQIKREISSVTFYKWIQAILFLVHLLEYDLCVDFDFDSVGRDVLSVQCSVWRVIITSVPAVYRPTSVHRPSADECPQSFSLDVPPPAGSDRDGDRKTRSRFTSSSVHQSMTFLPWTSSQLVFVIINQLQSSASTNKPKHMVRFCQKSTCWHADPKTSSTQKQTHSSSHVTWSRLTSWIMPMNSEKAQLSWFRTLLRKEAAMSLSILSSSAMCLCSSSDGQGSAPIGRQEEDNTARSATSQSWNISSVCLSHHRRRRNGC